MDQDLLKQYYTIYTEYWQIFKRAALSDKSTLEIYRQMNAEADVLYQKYRALDKRLLINLYGATASAIVRIKEDNTDDWNTYYGIPCRTDDDMAGYDPDI